MAKVLDRGGVTVADAAQQAATDVLPSFRWTGEPSRVVENLESALARETTRVSDALLLSLQEFITSEIESWFGQVPKSLNRTALKKLTNSVASTGTSGNERTIEALSVISSWSDIKGKNSAKSASESIRESAADFRKAKSFLAHQAKCINAFIKYWQQEEKSLTPKEKAFLDQTIKSREDFRLWAKSLSDSWLRAGGVDSSKNNKMYQSYWSKFVESIDSERDDNYSLELIRVIERDYLEDSHKNSFLKHLNNVSLVNRNTVAFKAPSQSSMKVESGVISISTSLNINSASLNTVKENLALLCAQESVLQSRKLEISEEVGGEVPAIIVSFNAPKELTVYRRTVDLVNKLVKEAYRELV